MKKILTDIQNGKFAREWVKEAEKGYPNYKQFQKDEAKHEIEKTGTRLRSLMPWVKKRNLKGAQASYSN